MQIYKIALLIVNILIFFSLESFFPFFRREDFVRRLWHSGKNLLLGGLNALLAALIFGALYSALFNWMGQSSLGLLNNLPLPPVGRFVLALLLIDLWMYTWHRLNHTLPFLWAFHAVHHTDREMDASTFIRFHPVEILLSSIFKLPIFLIIGPSLEIVLTYEIILNLSTIFHHSNLGLPDRVDSLLRIVIVTPNMHRVHHSLKLKEGNSNYSTTLSIWDKLLFSFVEPNRPREIKLGVKGYEEPKWQTLPGMFITPFKGPGEPLL